MSRDGTRTNKMAAPDELVGPQRLVRFCGADCAACDTYRRFLAGDRGGLVNRESDYRCCWLPADYPKGTDCPIKTCCEGRGVRFCGACEDFRGCTRMQAFYAPPGYGVLYERMLETMGPSAPVMDQSCSAEQGMRSRTSRRVDVSEPGTASVVEVEEDTVI